MKKSYILFLTLPLFLTLLYLSLWWSLVGVAGILIFLAYRFYAERLEAAMSRNEVLQMDIEALNIHLEQAVLKEQRASKEAGQIKELKQQLLSVLSHEIRTPMNGIIGMSHLLKDTQLTQEQQEYNNTIYSCSESLLSTVNTILVNDILDLSKLHQDANPLEYKNFELQDCLEEVLDLFGDKAGKAGIDLLCYIDEDVPAHVLGDSRYLRQILMNLVENSVRFTQRGEVFIGVHRSPRNEPGKSLYLDFEVRDTGVGIAADQLKQLFKGIPGKEVPKESEKNISGLGLVICKTLAELMGGSIIVMSQPGQGSTFIVSVPLAAALQKADSDKQEAGMLTASGKHILIVDDNAASRDILMRQVRNWKMIPVSADSASQALEILSRQRFDMVLTDVSMPETGGLQLAGSIRAQFPSMPVIGMSLPGDTASSTEPGIFSSIVPKPIRQRLLRDRLGEIFTQGSIPAGNSLSSAFSAQYPLRILIAEDNHVNQVIATKILRKLGYEPKVANHGKEVMEMVGHEHYDIILMDVQMPEMNGLEATRMIRTCLEVQPIIIAVTANVMQGDRNECMQAGMDDYMSKPIEVKELLRLLEKWALAIRGKRKISA